MPPVSPSRASSPLLTAAPHLSLNRFPAYSNSPYNSPSLAKPSLSRPFASFFKPLSNFNSAPPPENNIVPIRGPVIIDGVRTVCYSAEEVAKLVRPFEFALLGKFFQRRPKIDEIRRSFSSISFKGHVSLGSLKKGFVLIQVENKEDYSHLWSSRIWKIAGQPMKIFKWMPSFDYSVEPSIVPVWINLHDLPIHLFEYNVLSALGDLVGKTICLDNATLRKTRPTVARICVEIDMAEPLPSSIQILLGDDLFYQYVDYENLPRYCLRCRVFGHDIKVCKQSDIHNRHINDELKKILKIEVVNDLVVDVDSSAAHPGVEVVLAPPIGDSNVPLPVGHSDVLASGILVDVDALTNEALALGKEGDEEAAVFAKSSQGEDGSQVQIESVYGEGFCLNPIPDGVRFSSGMEDVSHVVKISDLDTIVRQARSISVHVPDKPEGTDIFYSTAADGDKISRVIPRVDVGLTLEHAIEVAAEEVNNEGLIPMKSDLQSSLGGSADKGR